LVVILIAFCVIPGTGIQGKPLSGDATAFGTVVGGGGGGGAPEMPPALVAAFLGVVSRFGVSIRRAYAPKSR